MCLPPECSQDVAASGWQHLPQPRPPGPCGEAKRLVTRERGEKRAPRGVICSQEWGSDAE